MNVRRLKTLTLPILLVAGLAACSPTSAPATGSSSDATSTTAAGGSGADSIVIEHVFGETTIPAVPERVATVNWANQDVVLALGVVPVGFAAQTWGVEDGSGILPWTKDALDELGAETPVLFDETDGLDFEKINETDPDVILAAYSGITADDYATLSEIAPTVAYPTTPWSTPWRELITTNATAIGKAEEGETLVTELEQLIADSTAAYPQFEGKTAAFVYADPADTSTIGFYTTGDPRAAYLTDLGFEVPASVQAASESSDSFYHEVSAEQVDTIADIDIIVFYGDEAALQALQADPLLGQLPAIARGSVVLVADGSFAASTNPTPLSIPWGLEQYLQQLGEAADRVQ